MSLRRLAQRVARSVRAWRAGLIVRRNAPSGVFAVDVASSNGLGARLQCCLELFAFCDETGLIPRIRFTYRGDPARTDYFAPFFSMRLTTDANPGAQFARIHTVADLCLGRDYDASLSIPQAHALLTKYLEVREPVVDEVNAFVGRHFAGGAVLGVHYRGTDKVSEAPPVPHSRVIRNILHYLERFPETQIVFLATDDATLLPALHEIDIGRPLVTRPDAFRSADGRPVHGRTDVNRLDVYRDAIVNCLLLSRCTALLKTASFLSDFSCLFNPQLKLVMLNEPYRDTTWFPARALVKTGLYEALP